MAKLVTTDKLKFDNCINMKIVHVGKNVLQILQL